MQMIILQELLEWARILPVWSFGKVPPVLFLSFGHVERKRAEQELSTIAMDLRRLIESANAPILGIDQDGLVNEWNEQVIVWKLV